MYINPFLAGVLATILVELLLLFIGAGLGNVTIEKKEVDDKEKEG